MSALAPAAQGLGLVAVLLLEVGDLAGQSEDQRVFAVVAGGLGGSRPGLGGESAPG